MDWRLEGLGVRSDAEKEEQKQWRSVVMAMIATGACGCACCRILRAIRPDRPLHSAPVLQAVKNLHQLCSKGERNGDLVARVYPHLTKIFSRCSESSSTQKTSTGLLLLAILQFFLDFGEPTSLSS